MRRMDLEEVAAARDLVAATFNLRAASGFWSHLSGKRLAAPRRDFF